MRILVTICGRGGSKGVPNKNIIEIGGIPLIAYSIKRAKEFSQLYEADLALSTDSELIKNTAAAHGLTTDYERPSALGSDEAGKLDVLRDLLIYEENKRSVKYDYILDLDITSPLRTIQDLQAAFEKLTADNNASNIYSVNSADKNPYFNMVELDANGYSQMSKDGGKLLARQAAPKVYDINGSFYFYKRDFFDNPDMYVVNNKSLVFNVKHACFDIDTEVDYLFMKYLIEEGQLDFEL